MISLQFINKNYRELIKLSESDNTWKSPVLQPLQSGFVISGIKACEIVMLALACTYNDLTYRFSLDTLV